MVSRDCCRFFFQQLFILFSFSFRFISIYVYVYVCAHECNAPRDQQTALETLLLDLKALFSFPFFLSLFFSSLTNASMSIHIQDFMGYICI